jgi:hypothetical protein
MSAQIIANNAKSRQQARRDSVPDAQITAERIGEDNRWIRSRTFVNIAMNALIDFHKWHRFETIRRLSAMSTCARTAANTRSTGVIRLLSRLLLTTYDLTVL